MRRSIKTSSCKAKGRRFQQKVRNDLRAIGSDYGLENADAESRGMGQQGEDIILSPAFRKLLDLDIECKNVEHLNVVDTFLTHNEKYEDRPSLKLLTHTRNHSKPLVTLLWSDFITILRRILPDVKHSSTGSNSVSQHPR